MFQAKKEAAGLQDKMKELQATEEKEERRRKVWDKLFYWYDAKLNVTEWELYKREILYPYTGRMLQIPNPEVPWDFRRKATEEPSETRVSKRARRV